MYEYKCPNCSTLLLVERSIHAEASTPSCADCGSLMSRVWSFNLSDMPQPIWEDRWLPQNTEFSNRGNKTKVVGYLSIKDGKEL